MGKRSLNSNSHLKSLLSPKGRAWVYGVFLAASPIAIYRGFVDSTEAGLWISAIGAILAISNSLALSNVPGVTKDRDIKDAG